MNGGTAILLAGPTATAGPGLEKVRAEALGARTAVGNEQVFTTEAAKLMVDNKYNCLPVVRDTKVLGIITSSDLLAALVHEVDPEFVAARALEAS